MTALTALLAVLALAGLAAFGGMVQATRPIVAVALPAAAFIVFAAGILVRVTRWALAPEPFRIPVTCGQQKSLPWIKSSWIENPSRRAGVMVRMALEVLVFRSLFRHTRSSWTSEPVVLADGSAAGGDGDRDGRPRLVDREQKWLWLAALAFHWSMLVVVLRHLRFFAEPVPSIAAALASADGFFQMGSPTLFLTDVTVFAGLGYLLLRRLCDAQVRFISLFQDYFALYLLLAIAGTGVLMRYVVRQDVIAAKQLAMGLVSLAPVVPAGTGVLLAVHLCLVSVLLAYLPFSKLVHFAGVVLSPTRNLANTSRMRRHVNPWNAPVGVHTYEEWEDEFRDKIRAAGLPVETESRRG
jgi:nitrate reductase gamma subunit